MEILAFTFWVLFNIRVQDNCAMFQGIVLAASARGEDATLNSGALQKQKPPGLQSAAAEGGRDNLHGERERGLAAMLLPVSPTPCASSGNLIYLKAWMLSKWYKCVAFSVWINMEKTANKPGKGRVWRWLWRVWSCTVTLALSCPLTKPFVLSCLTAMTQDAAEWWLWKVVFFVRGVYQ